MTDYTYQTAFFYDILMSHIDSRIENTKAKGKTSFVLFTIDLQGFTWAKYYAERREIDSGSLRIRDSRYAKYFVRLDDDFAVNIKDLWHQGLRDKVQDYFTVKNEDGSFKLFEDEPIRTANVFMKHTKKTNEDGTPVKGIWFVIVDWSRNEQSVPVELDNFPYTTPLPNTPRFGTLAETTQTTQTAETQETTQTAETQETTQTVQVIVLPKKPLSSECWADTTD